MNISTIKTAIYSWANSNVGGSPVVWADQAAPRPPRPYVTLRLNGPYRVAGADELRLTTTAGVPEITGHRRLVLTVTVHGDSIYQKAYDLNFSLGKPSVQASFRASNISISNEGNLVNLTKFMETKFDEIYTFDVEFLVTSTSTDNTGYITKTEVTGFGETNIIGN
jgi:hypothetical protein